ncbi:MAG: pyruvoyl-dependent arginine decarboxylase [Anaerolineaceae bacterium]|nr:pyruvoyl-dependent arginine decarboxylase [Anaerolineaceae bacterium]
MITSLEQKHRALKNRDDLHIVITKGVGEGPTTLAAFDAALLDAGVANYNLIYLSSIIPPGSQIECARYVTPADEYGHRLYVVMARAIAQQPGEKAWAGVGWTQNEEDGRGLFVELEGGSKEEVETAIHSTLDAMIVTRSTAYGPIHAEMAGIECTANPVCALVTAVYKSEGWTD